jgi:NADH-quinone oxidoreductase subunit J
MTFSHALFVIVAAGTAASAVGVVASPGIIRSAIFLLFTLVGVALTFFLLGAEFLGAAQLIIYVGGTLVLVVFGGMLTAGGPFSRLEPSRKDWLIGLILSGGLFILLTACSLKFAWDTGPPRALPATGGLGLSFLGFAEAPGRISYLLPFELISIHLLVALIGAAYLARAKGKRGAA